MHYGDYPQIHSPRSCATSVITDHPEQMRIATDVSEYARLCRAPEIQHMRQVTEWFRKIGNDLVKVREICVDENGSGYEIEYATTPTHIGKKKHLYPIKKMKRIGIQKNYTMGENQVESPGKCWTKGDSDDYETAYKKDKLIQKTEWFLLALGNGKRRELRTRARVVDRFGNGVEAEFCSSPWDIDFGKETNRCPIVHNLRHGQQINYYHRVEGTLAVPGRFWYQGRLTDDPIHLAQLTGEKTRE